jgi:hypothetical protein
MPDTTIPTYVTAERFDRANKHGLAAVAQDSREDLSRGYVDLLSALRWLKDAGDAKGVHSYLEELAKVARDGISARDAECRKDVDEAGIYCEPIDLTELDHIITALTLQGTGKGKP